MPRLLAVHTSTLGRNEADQMPGKHQVIYTEMMNLEARFCIPWSFPEMLSSSDHHFTRAAASCNTARNYPIAHSANIAREHAEPG